MNRPQRLASMAALFSLALVAVHCDKSAPPSAVSSPKGPAAGTEATKGDVSTPKASEATAGKTEASKSDAPSGTPTTAKASGAPAKSSDAAAGTSGSGADASASGPTPKGDAAATAKTAGDSAAPSPAPGANPVVSPAMKVPVEESYKATVARAIVAAMTEDEEKGWALYQKELHTKEIFPQRLKAIRRFNWPAMRRKVKLYLKDDTKPEFTITRIDTIDDRTVKVFVHNERSLPTPCILQKDSAQNGEYRITNCSL